MLYCTMTNPDLPRFPQVVATRDWDKVTPNLPPGPSHNLAFNGYYTRDGRREVHPPTVLADGTMVILYSR